MRYIPFFCCIFITFIIGSCTENPSREKKDTTLIGMGASFPYPFYNIIFTNFIKESGIKVISNEYSSGSAIRALQDKTIDFAGIDAYITDKELSELPYEALLVPTCVGGVVITYNIPGVKNLKLTGELISDIYLQNITYWDDNAIKNINPGVELPHLPITTIYRSDGSGTSYVFSDFLSKVSPEWDLKMGKGKSLNWRSGIAVKGNIMVASTVASIKGALGYTSLEHASFLDLPSAAIQNSSGIFIKANKHSILAAADIDFPDDMRIMITNSNNKDAYPLSCFSWILVYKNQAYNNRSIKRFENLKSLLEYILSPDSQKVAGKITYAALPEDALKKAKKIADSMVWQKTDS